MFPKLSKLLGCFNQINLLIIQQYAKIILVLLPVAPLNRWGDHFFWEIYHCKTRILIVPIT
jgi:hypothetical protein